MRRIASRRLVASFLAVVMTLSLLPIHARAAGAAESVHIATYVGEMPQMDGVTWDSSVTEDSFSTVYAAVKISGAKADGTVVNAMVEVVPRGTVYFIDSYSATPEDGKIAEPAPYTAVKALVGVELKNDKSDQKASSGSWGFSGTVSAKGINTTDGRLEYKGETGLYTGAKTGTIVYTLAGLSAGTYTISSAHHEWWNGRAVKLTVSYRDAEGKTVTQTAADKVAVSGKGDEKTNSYTFDLPVDGVVTYTVSNATGGEAPTISWLALCKGYPPLDMKGLKTVISEAEAFLTEDGGDYAKLSAALEKGKALLSATAETTPQATIDKAVQAIQTALDAVKPSQTVRVTVKGADVDAAAENINGLTYKGWGLLNGNSTSNLLMDYKAENPLKYWEMMEVLFGGERPLFSHVKMEMGNDGNNSTGADACTMRTENEEADASRSPGFAMAADAKKINPAIKISMLRWELPNWVKAKWDSNTNNEGYEAFYKWYSQTIFDAYEKYGYVVDFVSPDRNETDNPNTAFIKWFANRVENETNFPDYMDAAARAAYNNIRIIASDENKGLQIVPNMRADGDLYDAVDIIGFHYRTNATDDYVAMADVDDKEVWYSEGCATFGYTELQENKNAASGGGTLGGYQSPLAMVDGYLCSFVSSRRTHYIFQPAIGAFYEGIQYGHKELVSARDPWSGNIHYDPALYMLGHFVKFSDAGWENETNTAGVWRAIPQASASFPGSDSEHNTNSNNLPSYMTLAARDKSDFSVVIINNTAKTMRYEIATEDMALRAGTALQVWETATDSYMQDRGTLTEQGGYYALNIYPYSMVTVTSLSAEEAAMDTLPQSADRAVLDTDGTGKYADTSDSTLYADNFEYAEEDAISVYNMSTGAETPVSYLESRGNEPRYLLDSHGAWVVENGQLVQALTSGVAQWNGGDAMTIVGDFRWMNYKAGVDIDFAQAGASDWGGIGVRSQRGMNWNEDGYTLHMEKNGTWNFYRAGTKLESGQVGGKDSYRLELEAKGRTITAYVDGQEVAAYLDAVPFDAGRVKLSCAWSQVGFDNLSVNTVGGYIPYATAMFDNQDDGVSYSGGWNIPGPGGGSADDWYRTTSANTAAGASFTFAIDGTGFALTGANNGGAVLDVEVDGEQVATGASTLASARRYSAYTYSGLENGPHTVTVTVTSGTLTLDAIYALGEILPGGGREALQALIDEYEAKGLVEANFAPETWKTYTDALAAAKKLLEDSVTEQSALDEAYQVLKSAFTALIAKNTPVEVTDTTLPKLVATTAGGVIVGLPATVKVKTYDGTANVDAPIVWNNSAALFTTPFAVVSVVGTVTGGKTSAGKPLTVSIPVEVLPADPAALRYFVDCGTGSDWAKPPAGTDKVAVIHSLAYGVVTALEGVNLLNTVSDQIYNMAGKSNTWGAVVGLRVNSTRTDPLRSPDGAKAGDSADKYAIGLRTGNSSIAYKLTLDTGSYTLTTGCYDWYTGRDRNFNPVITYTDPSGTEQTLTLELIDLPSQTLTNRDFVLPPHTGAITLTYKQASGEAPLLSWFAVAERSADPADTQAVAGAKILVENGGFTPAIAQAEGNTRAAVKAAVEARLNALPGFAATGVTAEVLFSAFTPAVEGMGKDPDGTDGSFAFSVLLTKGGAMDVTTPGAGTIKATYFVYVPNASLSGVEDVNWKDTDGVTIQAHGGQVQWLDTLDLDGDGTAEGGWIWYGEDKTRNGKPIDGIRCYVSADLYNWTDKGTVLYTHDVLPIALSGSSIAPNAGALTALKATAALPAPTGEATQEQIDAAKAFLAAYDNGDGTYDEDHLAKAFQNLYSGYCIAERPKMLYNESTGQYVLVYHADAPSDAGLTTWLKSGGAMPSRYSRASMGFAVSDTPYGPFKLVNVTRMNYVDGYYDSSKGMARDMNVFLDDTDIDGNGVKDAYAIYSSEENKYMYVSLLNGDYTGPATAGNVDSMTVDGGTSVKTFAARVLGTDQTAREAPAIFKYGGYYYMITSGTSGWTPNQARYHRAESIYGPYTAMGDPCIGDTGATTFRSQPTAIIPVDAENGKFIYMGDRWIESALGTSGYMWLPIELNADGTLALRSYSDWTLNALDTLGPVTINTELPQTVLLGRKVVLPTTLSVTVGGQAMDTAVVWDQVAANGLGYTLGTVTVKGTLTGVNGRAVSVKINVVPPETVYFVDSGAAAATDYFQAVADAASGAMRNQTPDQAYTAGNWGYTGTGTTARGTTSADPHEALRYVTSSTDRNIVYRFDGLEAGEYKVFVGFYDPWYSSSKGVRVANVSLQLGEAQLGETQSHTITSAKDMITFRGVNLTESGDLQVKIVPKNSGSNTDVQVSFIAIVKFVPEEISGSVAVAGTAAVGSTLSADLTALEPAEAADSLTYQWYRGDDAITGAVDDTYTLTPAEVGAVIHFTATGSGDYFGTLTAAATAAVDKGTQSAPVGVTASGCTTEENSDGVISGVTGAMEYMPAGGTDWNAVTGNQITGLTYGRYLVRYAETDACDASASVTVTVTPWGAPPKQPLPTASFEVTDMTLYGLMGGMLYSVDGGGNWTSVADDTYSADLSAHGLTAGSTIRLYMPGDGELSSDSDEQVITLTQAAAPAGLGKTDETEAGNGGSVTGVTTDMEYKAENGAVWTGVTGSSITGLAPGAYLIRVKGGGSVFASESIRLVIEAYSATVPVSGVTLDRADAALYWNASPNSITLAATVSPANAGNAAVTWSSSAPLVAGVSENGTVTALSAGTAVITATTAEGGFTASCTVTVSMYSYVEPSNPAPTPPKAEQNSDGSTTTTTVDQKTGTTTAITQYPDGTKVVTTTPKDGVGTSVVTLPEGKDRATVTIPTMEKPGPGIVAVIVKSDGTREVVKTSVATGEGMKLTLTEGATIQLVDNTKTFSDVPVESWAGEAITFVTSRELFQGTGAGTFAPNGDMSRAMLMTVLYRYQGGNETEGGEKWYSEALQWATESGLSDGSNPDGSITREQLAVLLYRFIKPEDVGETDLNAFGDAAVISDWAAEAMRWAVSAGIMGGKGNAVLDPQGTATRAEVAAMLMRVVQL